MLILSQADVRRLLDVGLLVDALAAGFRSVSSGRSSVPPRIASFIPEKGLLAAMPGYVEGVLEAKLVSVFPRNHDHGLPSHQALIVLFDAETGSPLALMDGTHITAMRTAAAAALATRTLARENSTILAILGAGVQGASHLQAMREVGRFGEVRIASRDLEHARNLAASSGATAANSFEEAVRGADVVCCCTDAAEPILSVEWLKEGAHVTSVGANPQGPELDPQTLRAGLLVVESRAAFLPPPAGSAELRGMDPELAAELGEILLGVRPGRTSPAQITVYKSMGHAMEDAVAAGLVHQRALSEGVGTRVEL